MKLLKKHKLTLIAFLFAIIFLVAASMGTYSVFARTVAIDGSTFFYTNGDSSVRAHKESSDEYYTMFHFESDEDNVTYRYNLAYQWYQASSSDSTVGEKGWFNLTVGFENADFERYVIKFQSQQYIQTKDGVTTNYVVFVADGAGYVYCFITDDEDTTLLDISDVLESYTLGELDCVIFPVYNDDAVNKITIAFTDYNAGEYSVSITDDNSASCTGTFKNIGYTYSKRVNSTTAGVMPLTFTAYFGDDSEDNTCDMVLYTLNNQSFLLTDDDETIETNETGSDDGNNTSYYTSSSEEVTDDQPPVLCIKGNLSYFEYGEALDFDYVVIDVLASSPKSTINYYVLSAEIYEAAVTEGSVSYFTDNTTDDDTGESLFDKTSDDDDAIIVESANAFLTDEIIEANKSGDSGYTVGCLVKAFIEITDVTSSTGNNASTIVYLDWYISPENLEYVTVGGQTCSFIKAVTDEQGATYITGTELEDKTEEYQAKIDELAIENGEIALTAGSSSKFYLPSFEGFITDNLDGYEDLTYAIYYTVDGSQNSASSLSFNTLSISLSSAGTYKFTIYATDSASNSMYYIDADGELVEFDSSDIYDDELKDYIPWFTFEVVYTGVTVEDPGEQTTGYVDTEYSISSFDINGVSSYYSTAYSLYRFNRTQFIEDTGISLSYSEFVENVQALFEDTYLEGVSTRTYFTSIKELSSLNETDNDYDDFVDYAWSSSSLSFVPQDETAYYLVRLTVTDTYNHQADVYSYMGIHVSAAADSYAGESDWLENNLTSVILFSIAGVALIGIIILFIIKPKDDVDLDEQLANEEDGKKGKKGKKKKIKE